jgi:ribosome biogenesis GTPase
MPLITKEETVKQALFNCNGEITMKSANLYDRHQNKRALAKKQRAKTKHFASLKEEEIQQANIDLNFEVNIPPENSSLGILAENRGGHDFYVNYQNIMILCKLDRKFPFEIGKSLVVGDKVYFEQDNEDANWIRGMLPRKNFLARMRGDSTRFSAFQQETHVIAANIDIAGIVAPVANPKFHPNFIDRYLIICQNGNVTPLVCLNKVDLTGERHPILVWYKEKLDLKIIETSIITANGLDELRNYLKYKTTVLIGNSGVGKSSIINQLKSDANIKTQTVSSKTGEGRHTTTSSNLYIWYENSYIIDTPGIRSLGLDYIDKYSLSCYFPEFEEFREFCKYPDCLHEYEPNCGIKEAMLEGKLNICRYESYLRILKSLI